MYKGCPMEKGLLKLLNCINEAIYCVDRNRVITFWNKAAEKITGFSAVDVLGSSCKDEVLCHVDGDGNHLCSTEFCPMVATLKDGIPRKATVYLHHKEGHRIPVAISISGLFDEDESVIGGIELFTDVSNNEANELRVKELEKLALIDKLTQLANRHYLDRELKSRMCKKKRSKTPFAVLLIDIDFFKRINDGYGHDIGDKILQQVAKTMQKNARPFDVYGRWGGEEFLGIIGNIPKASLQQLADRIRVLIGSTYLMVNDRKVSVTVSIGAAHSDDSDDIKNLINQADELLYRSKLEGRNRVSLME